MKGNLQNFKFELLGPFFYEGGGPQEGDVTRLSI